ncbi:MAG: acetyl-CoA carboxylase, carboxyltransferase subunit beta [Armatimonadetes bacterium]|nr:acetyl-CoA carboxylase, carboxyltransferase subunit beta [Armatimonadota bacterium]
MRSGKPSPAGRFVQCQGCKKTLFATDFEANFKVCPYCSHHHRLNWSERIAYTFDEDSFQEMDADLVSSDPLAFPDYKPKHDAARSKTGMEDSVACGIARLIDMPVSVAVSDFHFMGGSMGSVAGEKVTRTLERGCDMRCPVIIFCASGGARMQEGLVSLMQMAKTTAAVERCRSHGIPYISVFTDPTMAGVLASYASVADVILAEPKALVGFAGARVSKQAQVVKAPDDFQQAEWVLRSGMLDRIVERRDMRSTLGELVRMLGAHLRQGAAVVA